MLKNASYKNSKIAWLTAASIFAITLMSAPYIYAETQNADGNSEPCSGAAEDHASGNFSVCQADGSSGYRYSRWVYYTVTTANLPSSGGKKYIPPVGPADGQNGIKGSDGVNGWLIVSSEMSDCIIENGGFWRRGYFQWKNDIYSTRDYNGETFGAQQNGLAPVGYTGRSSDNISDKNQVGHDSSWHWTGEQAPTNSLGQQTLYYGSMDKVWAKMDTSKGTITDSQAQALVNEFNNSSNPTTLDYGDYFLDNQDGADAGNATVLFCYSDSAPFNGDVQIGNASNNYAFESKTYETSKSSGVYKNGTLDSSTHTIDLGKVSSNKYTPSQFLMKVAKSSTKSGSTSYTAKMTQGGTTKYVFDGHNWASGTTPSTLTTSSSVTSSTSPEFTLSEGENTICVMLSYKEKSSNSSYQDLTACATITYDPLVAAIDSTTTLTLNGVQIGSSGADASKIFDEDEVKSKIGAVDYGAGKVNAKWDYLLYSTGRCQEGNFHATYCNPSISTSETFKANYNRIGALYNDSDSQTATLSSTEYKFAPGSTSKSYNLLPGETITTSDSKQGVRHRSGVRVNGDNATGSKDEESSAGFTVTAKNAVCNINGLEFGLNNPVNYGRMTVYKGGTARYYGNGKNSEGAAVWNTNGPLYFRPDEELKIGYDACLGQQIKADKDSGKSWDAEWTTGNAKLTVGITGSLLDSSHFTSTGNAVSTDSADGRNILAYEVLGKKISSHVGKNYQFYNVNSKPAQIGNLGHSIVSDFGDLSGCPEGGSNCKAHAVLNVPYNYILTPSTNEFTESIVTIGDSFKFKTSINKTGRINEDVQSTAYSTNIKKTWAKYLTFKLSTGVDYSNLNTVANNIATLDNNQTDNLGGILRANLGGSSIIDMGSGEFTDDEIKNGTTKEIPVNATDADAGYNKLCVAVAVYPADSHNSRNDTIGAGADQSNALTGDPGSNAFTRITVSCRTVGKYPTFSTEGNGILSGGNVSGNYTRYNDERDFGSWSEYGLIANEVDKVASGASIAYIDAQSGINAGVSYDRAGKTKNQLDSPQTLGNMNKSEIGLRDSTEASVYANQMTEIANNIKSTFFTDPMPVGGPFLVEYPGTHTWVNLNYKDDVWIGDAEAVAINYHRLAGDQVIIYSDKNIMIENKVTNLDAMLVANGKVDTCYRVDESGNKIDVDQGGDNSQLLSHCHDNLTVNGAVYSKEAIELDRTYGGGSETDLNLREDTLVKRAEIFNFDPRTVKWGYDYDNGNQPLITTYIEELSTRY